MAMLIIFRLCLVMMLALLPGVALAACPTPNPNLQGPPHFQDGCPLPAQGLNLTAPANSPALTGTPTAPTQPTGDASNAIATDAFVKSQGYIGGNLTGSCTIAGNIITCPLANGALETYMISGNTTVLGTVFGPLTPGDVVLVGASGNLIDGGKLTGGGGVMHGLLFNAAGSILLNSGGALLCNNC